MIVGWHALTLPQDPKQLVTSRWDMLATLLAIGLDPKKSIIFHQDHVRGTWKWMKFVVDNAGQNQDHLELGWILNCLTSVGRLSRMTTWKSRLAASRNTDESNVDESLLNAGLLTYPSLQAADILVYRYALSCSRLSLFIRTKGNSCSRRWRPNPALRIDPRSCWILQSRL